jgi:hypothetical protein
MKTYLARESIRALLKRHFTIGSATFEVDRAEFDEGAPDAVVRMVAHITEVPGPRTGDKPTAEDLLHGARCLVQWAGWPDLTTIEPTFRGYELIWKAPAVSVSKPKLAQEVEPNAPPAPDEIEGRFFVPITDDLLAELGTHRTAGPDTTPVPEEVVAAVAALGLNFNLGTAVAHIAASASRPGIEDAMESLRAARWHITREIEHLGRGLSE